MTASTWINPMIQRVPGYKMAKSQMTFLHYLKSGDLSGHTKVFANIVLGTNIYVSEFVSSVRSSALTEESSLFPSDF